jgi:uncharacterized membrane protein YkvI
MQILLGIVLSGIVILLIMYRVYTIGKNIKAYIEQDEEQ